jgi:hypothetical protein
MLQWPGNIFSSGSGGYSEHFNIYGYMLYDELDEDIIEFMSKHASLLDIMGGNKCNIIYYENPDLNNTVWIEQAKEVFGDSADEYLKKWKNITPYDRNRSHKIADELNIPSEMFPCIIFLKDLKSKECSKPYPLINDKRFYRSLFSLIKNLSKDPDFKIEKLDDEMGSIKKAWFIPKYIDDRVELLQRYTNPVISLVQPFIEIISSLKP